MATSTPVRTTAPEPRRGKNPRPQAARVGRRLTLSAACYAGIVLMIALTVAASRVLPTAAGVALFTLGMAAVVALAHPALRLTHRSR